MDNIVARGKFTCIIKYYKFCVRKIPEENNSPNQPICSVIKAVEYGKRLGLLLAYVLQGRPGNF